MNGLPEKCWRKQQKQQVCVCDVCSGVVSWNTNSKQQEGQQHFIYFYTRFSLKAGQIWSKPEQTGSNVLGAGGCHQVSTFKYIHTNQCMYPTGKDDLTFISQFPTTYFFVKISIFNSTNIWNKLLCQIKRLPHTQTYIYILGIKQLLLPLYVFVMLAVLLISICSFMATLILWVRFADQSPSLPPRHFHVPSSNLTPAPDSNSQLP